jgi:PAS domain-containing protein
MFMGGPQGRVPYLPQGRDRLWISESCRAVRDAQGKLPYYEGTVVDITRRRQMEQELRNSESLYHSLVETMPQNVFWVVGYFDWPGFCWTDCRE